LVIKAFNAEGQLDTVWNSGEVDVEDSSIFPGDWISTDANENDGSSIYSSDEADSDDVPDLSQGALSDSNIGDRSYYLQIWVWNESDQADSYPRFEEGFDDTDLVRFILDKTPPGASMVCGTQRHVPSTDEYDIKTEVDGNYLQDSNIFWEAVEVKSDTYPEEWVEITQNDSPWLTDKTVSVRVKVKERNNENNGYYGHDINYEAEEDSTLCSGISATTGNYQYRYKSASGMSNWSSWRNCNNIQIVSTEEQASGGEKDVFVWLYANNVPLADGDSNLIQFRVCDVADLVVAKTIDEHVSYISPNMGYSHADTCLSEGVEYRIESDTFGYVIQIDSDKPEVILLSYPPNPYPHREASFKWVGIDSNDIKGFKWKLEEGKWEDQTWQDTSLVTYNPDWPNFTDMNNKYGQTSFGSTYLQIGKTYRFYVWARDATLKVSESPATWTWTVSPELPNTIITSGPSGEVHSTTATFTWRGEGGKESYEFSYQRDNGGWSAFASADNTSYSNLSEGTHVFEVKAKDANGYIDHTPASRVFVVVTIPPYAPLAPDKLYKYYREEID